jgi:alpha-L-fucosidase
MKNHTMNKQTTRMMLMIAALVNLPALAAEPPPPAPPALVKPTPEQAAWQDLELGMFYHFDINVFTDAGEGAWHNQGGLDPSLYNPAKLSTDQWLEAAKALGAKYSVFVAKHCTGFLSWQSDLYPYGVKQSKWRDGKGDVVKDYIASCKKHGVKPGLYCSTNANAHLKVIEWNGNNSNQIFGDDAKRAQYCKTVEAMLGELWGRYGPLDYVWFDGGAVPPAKGGPDIVPVFKKHQPRTVAFQGPPDAPAGNTRWPGNENGITSYPNWSTVTRHRDEGAGHPDGQVWEPAECDAPLRKHFWFWHPNQENTIRSLDELMDIYYKSVGRNANLIINANIDRDGLVPEPDMKRFKEFGDEIRRRFSKPIAHTTGEGDTVELDLGKPTTINHAIFMEKISEGERIREYVVEGFTAGAWKELCKGQSVGHKRIEQFGDAEVSKVRLRVTRSIAKPLIRQLAVYHVSPRTQ